MVNGDESVGGGGRQETEQEYCEQRDGSGDRKKQKNFK